MIDPTILHHPRRIVPITAGVNFRDVGGYPTQDGRTVKWGQVYRSGAINHLSAEGVADLSKLGLRLVYDLRSADEQPDNPDQLPDNPRPRYIHSPLNDPSKINRVRALWALYAQRDKISDLLLDGYVRVAIDKNALVLGSILRSLADGENRPILVHCTAGKDRTGIVIALLLSLLGVPEELIVADYALSNLWHAHFAERVNTDLAILKRLRLTAEDISPILIANPDTLKAMFAHIRQKYGSVTTYVTDFAGLDVATIERLRHDLLCWATPEIGD